MRMLIYIVLALVGLILLLAGAFGIVGSCLPEEHTASVTVEVGQPREKVWEALNDIDAFPSWAVGVDKVETLPTGPGGGRRFRQTQGRNTFVLEETAKEAPGLVTRTIDDDNKMFSGSWEHRLEEAPGGRTRVTVTEVGRVPSPIPRAIMRVFFGWDFYLNKFADALKAKCGS